MEINKVKQIIPEAPCPYCGVNMETIKLVNTGKISCPQPYDFTVCCHCSAILKFDGQMIPKKPTDEEYRIACSIKPLKNAAQKIREAWASEKGEFDFSKVNFNKDVAEKATGKIVDEFSEETIRKYVDKLIADLLIAEEELIAEKKSLSKLDKKSTQTKKDEDK